MKRKAMPGRQATTTVTFLVALPLFIAFFAISWLSLRMGARNEVPWAVQSAWGDLIGVGLGVEASIGYVPLSGPEPAHAAIVVSVAALLWAVVASLVVTSVLRIMRALRSRET